MGMGCLYDTVHQLLLGDGKGHRLHRRRGCGAERGDRHQRPTKEVIQERGRQRCGGATEEGEDVTCRVLHAIGVELGRDSSSSTVQYSMMWHEGSGLETCCGWCGVLVAHSLRERPQLSIGAILVAAFCNALDTYNAPLGVISPVPHSSAQWIFQLGNAVSKAEAI